MTSMRPKSKKPIRARSTNGDVHTDSVASTTRARRKAGSGKSLEKGDKPEDEPIKCASPPCYLREIED